MADEKKSARPQTVDECMAALIAPFPPEFVKFLPTGKGGTNTVPVAGYIDARAVMDRLDMVFGPEGWYDRYYPIGTGDKAQAECRLYVKFPGIVKWIMKPDVGSRSEQPNEEDQVKAMYSDSLKRAAVKFGIGRYLYRLGRMEAGWDANSKRITEFPVLPDWALPEPYRTAGAALADQVDKAARQAASLTSGTPDATKSVASFLSYYGYAANTPVASVERRHARSYLSKLRESIDNAPLPTDYPQTAAELATRLASYDGKLAAAGRCQVGDLIASVVASGVKSGYPSDLSQWDKNAQIRAAVEWAKAFDAAHPAKEKQKTSTTKPADAKPEPAAV